MCESSSDVTELKSEKSEKRMQVINCSSARRTGLAIAFA